jgi:hypothetical protein
MWPSFCWHSSTGRAESIGMRVWGLMKLTLTSAMRRPLPLGSRPRRRTVELMKGVGYVDIT